MTRPKRRSTCRSRSNPSPSCVAVQEGSWLDDRTALGNFNNTSKVWADQLQHWQQHGDNGERDRLLGRMERLRAAFGQHSVTILNAEATPVLGTSTSGFSVSPPLRQALREAMETGRVTLTHVYLDTTYGKSMWLDVVAPLTAGETATGAAVVMRIDARAYLLPLLRNWPGQSRSGVSALAWRDGDMLTGSIGLSPSPVASWRWARPVTPSTCSATASSERCAPCRAPPGIWCPRSTAANGWTPPCEITDGSWSPVRWPCSA